MSLLGGIQVRSQGYDVGVRAEAFAGLGGS